VLNGSLKTIKSGLASTFASTAISERVALPAQTWSALEMCRRRLPSSTLTAPATEGWTVIHGREVGLARRFPVLTTAKSARSTPVTGSLKVT